MAKQVMPMAGEDATAGTDLETLMARGAALHGDGDLEGAEAAYRHVLAQDPFQVPALFALACLYQETGRMAQAGSAYRRTIEIDPAHAPASNNLGSLLLAGGDVTGAAGLFGRAAALDEALAPAHANLALALERLGRVEEGADVLERFLEKRPEAVHLRRHLALMRFQQGDLDGAAGALWQALAQNPVMDGADRILLVLLQAALGQGRCRSSAPEKWVARLRQVAPNTALPELLDHGVASLTPGTAEGSWRALARRMDDLEGTPPSGNRSGRSAAHGPDRWAVLLNFGRSGTGFLHSLMDGHPGVSTLPGIYFKDFFAQGSWRAIFHPDPRRMAARFCDSYAVLFDARVRKNVPGNNHPAHFAIGVSEGFAAMGEEGRDHLTLDRPRFQQCLEDLITGLDRIEPFGFFHCVHTAFDAVVGRGSDPALHFYHIHNPDPYAFVSFLRRAPGCRILTMVRHPLQSLESWISKSMDEPGAYPEIVNKVVRMIWGVNRPEFSLFPSAGLRLEDLKARPDETLLRLCRFFGIPMDPSLKTPTMQGLRWWGEPGSVRLEKKGAFGQQPDDPTDRKVGSVLSDADQLVLRTLFYPFSLRFGYVAADQGSFLRDLGRIRPLLDRPFDFERRYAAAFPRTLPDLEKNLHCAYLRRLLVLRWESLMHCGDSSGLLDPL